PAENNSDHGERQGLLIRVNARSGQSSPLAVGYYENLRLSPDGHYLAGLREDQDIPSGPDVASETWPWLAKREIVVVDLRSKKPVQFPCRGCHAHLGSLAWSQDSRRLMFRAESGGGGAQWRLYDPANEALQELDTGFFRFACGRTNQ